MTKRISALVLAAIMMIVYLPASAIEVTGALEAVCCYPYGSDESNASYVFRYHYPIFSGDASQMINSVYSYEAEYIENFTLPVNGDMYGQGDIQYYTNLNADVTYVSDDYVSVLLQYTEMTGDIPYEKVAGHVFALHGSKAGTVVSLPYVLGALKQDENDEWLIDRQTNKCDDCVRSIIWERLQDLADEGKVNLYDDADEDFLAGCFYPQEDFYLDENGLFVFFIQQDSMCHAEDGILRFAISAEDILDEL